MIDKHQHTNYVSAIPQLSQLGMVSENFQHCDKLVTPGADLSLPNAYLKWYDIRRHEVDMPPDLMQASRSFLRAEAESGSLNIDGQLGFVELHHCTIMAFLIVSTWNNDNELWQTTYTIDLTREDVFHRVEAQDGNHRPVFCVWELAPVWHERQAWVRYLRSGRDEQAKYIYVNDRFQGPC